MALDAVRLQHCRAELAHAQPTGHKDVGSVSAGLLPSCALFQQSANLFHLHLTCLNFTRFLLACSSCLSRYLWMTRKRSAVSSRLVSSWNFLREHPISSSRSLIKKTNQDFSVTNFMLCWLFSIALFANFDKFYKCCILKSQIMGGKKQRRSLNSLIK